MNKELFIDGIKRKRDGNIESVIKLLVSPPGRKPRKRHNILSAFYNGLDETAKEQVNGIIAEAIDQAIFSFLCILDHVSFIEDDEDKAEFELYAIKGGKRILINDPKQEELHNLFNGLVLED